MSKYIQEFSKQYPTIGHLKKANTQIKKFPVIKKPWKKA